MPTIQKRKTQDGKVTYRVMIRLQGHPNVSATFDRRTDASEWGKRVEADMKAGRYFGAAKNMTLGELIDKYVDAIRDQRKTWAETARQLEWWRAKAGDEYLAAITPARIGEWRDELAATPKQRGGGKRSAADVNRTLAAISGALTHAVKELQWIERNPCERVKKPKESAGRIRYLTDDELPRLLAAVRESSHPDLLPAVLLALTTGARRGEVMGLRWSQIDFKRRTILLRQGETKNDGARALPLSGEIIDLLKARAKVRSLTDDRLFPPPRDGMVLELRDHWKAALVKAGIDVRPATRRRRGEAEMTSDFRWHDLRHTAASYLTMAGVSAIEVARVLGHKTLSMSLRYSHLDPNRVTELGDKLAERIGVGERKA